MKVSSSTLLIFFVLSGFVFVGCTTKKDSNKKDSDNESSEWIQLLNESNLDDWIPKIRGYEINDNYANTFRLEDGVLKVRYDEGYESFDNRFGHLFYKDTFSHYILKLEYRFVGEQCTGAPGWAYRNSGIMIHGQSPESMSLDQDFPASIEFQLLGSDSVKQQVTGSVCTPGTNIVIDGELILEHCIQSSSELYMNDQWVTAEVEVRGNEIIKHIINGDTVMVYNQPQLDDREPYYERLFSLNNETSMLSSGTISLQSEGHPCDFRNIEIKLLE